MLKNRIDGQLILLTGVILALSLLTMSLIAISITNVGKEQTTIPERLIEHEFEDIKQSFGNALKTNKKNFGDLKFDETVAQFKRIELRYGFGFDAEIVNREVDKVYVRLILFDSENVIEETVVYQI